MILSEDSSRMERENIVIDNYYIVIDYVADTTEIALVRDIELLFDIVYGSDRHSGVKISKAIKFDIKNRQATLDKLKILITFS